MTHKRSAVLMTVIKKVIIGLMFPAMAVSLAGCWNYREIETLAAVYSFGVDKGPKGKGYSITVEVSSLEASGKDSKLQPQLLSAEGDTIMEAIANLAKTSDKQIYWSQAKVGIISSDVAKEGVRELVDMLLRDSETRIDMYMVVSKEKTAKQVMRLSTENPSEMLGVRLAQLIENQKNLSKSPMVHVYQLADMLANTNQSGVLGAVCINSSDGQKKPEISGAAIFEDDKLKGFLDGDNTQYLLFATNDLKGSNIPVDGVDDDKDIKASIQIEKSKTSITPVYKDGEASMDIYIKTEGGIVELYNPNQMDDKKAEEELKNRCEKIISERTLEVIQRVQEDYGVDVFGFSNTFIRKKPSVWKNIGDNWNSEFSNMEFRIHTKLHITNTGEIEILSKEEL